MSICGCRRGADRFRVDPGAGVVVGDGRVVGGDARGARGGLRRLDPEQSVVEDDGPGDRSDRRASHLDAVAPARLNPARRDAHVGGGAHEDPFLRAADDRRLRHDDGADTLDTQAVAAHAVDLAARDVQSRPLDEADAVRAALTVDGEPAQRDVDAEADDGDPVPRQYGDARVDSGGDDDRHRLADGDRAVPRRIEDDDLAGRVGERERRREAAAGKDEGAGIAVRSERGHERARDRASVAGDCRECECQRQRKKRRGRARKAPAHASRAVVHSSESADAAPLVVLSRT